MKNNYYNEQLVKIEKLISDKKYERAFELIKEELDLPYIPRKIEEKLQILYSSISEKLKKEVATIGPEKIFELLLNKKIQDIEKYEIANLLNNININLYLDEIKKILLLKNVAFDFLIKSRLINLLLKQNIKQKISFLDKNDILFEIELNDLKPIELDINFGKDSLLIEKYLIKNPTALEVAFLILENSYFSFFPKTNKEKNLGIISCLVALKLLEQKDEFEELFKISNLNSKDLENTINNLMK